MGCSVLTSFQLSVIRCAWILSIQNGSSTIHSELRLQAWLLKIKARWFSSKIQGLRLCWSFVDLSYSSCSLRYLNLWRNLQLNWERHQAALFVRAVDQRHQGRLTQTYSCWGTNSHLFELVPRYWETSHSLLTNIAQADSINPRREEIQLWRSIPRNQELQVHR